MKKLRIFTSLMLCAAISLSAMAYSQPPTATMSYCNYHNISDYCSNYYYGGLGYYNSGYCPLHGTYDNCNTYGAGGIPTQYYPVTYPLPYGYYGNYEGAYDRYDSTSLNGVNVPRSTLIQGKINTTVLDLFLLSQTEAQFSEYGKAMVNLNSKRVRFNEDLVNEKDGTTTLLIVPSQAHDETIGIELSVNSLRFLKNSRVSSVAIAARDKSMTATVDINDILSSIGSETISKVYIAIYKPLKLSDNVTNAMTGTIAQNSNSDVYKIAITANDVTPRKELEGINVRVNMQVKVSERNTGIVMFNESAEKFIRSGNNVGYASTNSNMKVESEIIANTEFLAVTDYNKIPR